MERLKAFNVEKFTLGGRKFHTLTILSAKYLLRVLLTQLDLYSLYAWPLVAVTELKGEQKSLAELLYKISNNFRTQRVYATFCRCVKTRRATSQVVSVAPTVVVRCCLRLVSSNSTSLRRRSMMNRSRCFLLVFAPPSILPVIYDDRRRQLLSGADRILFDSHDENRPIR